MRRHIQNFQITRVRRLMVNFESKICTRDEAAQRASALPHPVVFTNGVFDVLHRGHVTYLAQARELGASLIVGVNSDASVKRLGKGDDRPINREDDRAALLAALGCVDLVTIFDEDTPLELIRLVHPHILVKGGDYDMDKLAESALVRGWGGKALAIPFIHQRSTTETLKRIRASL